MSLAIMPAPAELDRNSSLDVDDASLYEIIRGKKVVKEVSAKSIWFASRLQELLGPFVREHRLGRVATEMIFIMDPVGDDRRRPEVAFVSAKKWPLDRELPDTDWEVVPDLVVEIASPSNRYEKVLGKVGEYFGFGVQQVWVASPTERLVHIHESMDRIRAITTSGVIDGIEMLPGFSLPLATWFELPATPPAC